MPEPGPPPVDGTDLDEWERHLAAPLRGTKVIVGFEVLAGMTPLVQQLARWGAARPLLVAEGRGTGPVPTADEADLVMLASSRSESLTEQVRARMRPDELLTPDLVAAVESYDPEAEAVWWVSPVGLNTPMLDRPVLGGRPRHQAMLEDKLLVDGMLEAIGAPTTPARVAPAAYDALMEATQTVVEQTGVDQVVWSGDNRDGTNGGGDYVRWVRSIDHARDAAAFFAEHCDRVRVSAFLDGVPCSIHGIVLPDGVVTFCPVELISLREPETGRFVYGGLGTTWEPRADDAEQMRDLARRVGRHVQAEHDYRGAFGIDGVMTAEGFRVTEFNARFSGGLSRLSRAAAEAQLELVQVNALIGRDVARSAADIEALARKLLDDNRFIDVVGLSASRVSDDSVEIAVQAGDTRLEQTGPDAAMIGTVFAGPNPLGSFFRFVALDAIIPVGDRGAPLSVLLHEFANRTWGADIPTGLIAPDLRRAGSESAMSTQDVAGDG